MTKKEEPGKGFEYWLTDPQTNTVLTVIGNYFIEIIHQRQGNKTIVHQLGHIQNPLQRQLIQKRFQPQIMPKKQVRHR